MKSFLGMFHAHFVSSLGPGSGRRELHADCGVQGVKVFPLFSRENTEIWEISFRFPLLDRQRARKTKNTFDKGLANSRFFAYGSRVDLRVPCISL